MKNTKLGVTQETTPSKKYDFHQTLRGLLFTP